MKLIVLFLTMALMFPIKETQAGLPDWVIPSPFSIVLQLGRWMLSQDTNDEVYYVRVQATGDTESAARTEAFRLAVDQAVGSLLISETEIQNGNILRQDLINYNSGYVHDFEYVNIYRGSSKVTLQIDVYVSKSKIAERLTVSSKTEGDLQGSRIAEAFKSIEKEHKNGDKLLVAVLGDFPSKAIDLSNIAVEYTNPTRTPTLHLSFDVSWKPQYLEALKEASSNTMQSVGKLKENGVVFADHNCFFRCYQAFKTDKKRFGIIYHGLLEQSSPMLQVSLLDVNKQPVHQKCYSLNTNLYEYRRNWTIEIRTKLTSQEKISMDVSQMDIGRLDKVDLRVIAYRQCNL